MAQHPTEIEQLEEMAELSIFAPRSVADVEERLTRILNSRCACGDGPHENALHDLVLDDVPWLICRLKAAEAALASIRTLAAVTP